MAAPSEDQRNLVWEAMDKQWTDGEVSNDEEINTQDRLQSATSQEREQRLEEGTPAGGAEREVRRPCNKSDPPR